MKRVEEKLTEIQISGRAMKTILIIIDLRARKRVEDIRPPFIRQPRSNLRFTGESLFIHAIQDKDYKLVEPTKICCI